jgi:hypothetical protein
MEPHAGSSNTQTIYEENPWNAGTPGQNMQWESPIRWTATCYDSVA